MTIKTKRLTIILLTVMVVLLVPLVAMQFTNEVKWSVFDFAVAGVLLIGTGLACELVIRNIRKLKYRIAVCAAILILLVLIWAELSVGIFGTSFAGN